MFLNFSAVLLALSLNAFAGQERPPTQENPLAELKDQVKRVLAQAAVPFTEEQEKAVVLMMEDRREASEQLFGDLMNFRTGPTQGENADRLRSALEWMRNEFLTRLQDYLTREQLTAWSGSLAPRASQQTQTQFVRINNNAFTAEDASYRFGRSGVGTQAATEVI